VHALKVDQPDQQIGTLDMLESETCFGSQRREGETVLSMDERMA
jgi:hypothetical protein